MYLRINYKTPTTNNTLFAKKYTNKFSSFSLVCGDNNLSQTNVDKIIASIKNDHVLYQGSVDTDTYYVKSNANSTYYFPKLQLTKNAGKINFDTLLDTSGILNDIHFENYGKLVSYVKSELTYKDYIYLYLCNIDMYEILKDVPAFKNLNYCSAEELFKNLDYTKLSNEEISELISNFPPVVKYIPYEMISNDLFIKNAAISENIPTMFSSDKLKYHGNDLKNKFKSLYESSNGNNQLYDKSFVSCIALAIAKQVKEFIEYVPEELIDAKFINKLVSIHGENIFDNIPENAKNNSQIMCEVVKENLDIYSKLNAIMKTKNNTSVYINGVLDEIDKKTNEIMELYSDFKNISGNSANYQKKFQQNKIVKNLEDLKILANKLTFTGKRNKENAVVIPPILKPELIDNTTAKVMYDRIMNIAKKLYEIRVLDVGINGNLYEKHKDLINVGIRNVMDLLMPAIKITYQKNMKNINMSKIEYEIIINYLKEPKDKKDFTSSIKILDIPHDHVEDYYNFSNDTINVIHNPNTKLTMEQILTLLVFIKNRPDYFSDFPKDWQTQEICDAAICYDIKNYSDIEDKFKTPTMKELYRRISKGEFVNFNGYLNTYLSDNISFENLYSDIVNNQYKNASGELNDEIGSNNQILATVSKCNFEENPDKTKVIIAIENLEYNEFTKESSMDRISLYMFDYSEENKNLTLEKVCTLYIDDFKNIKTINQNRYICDVIKEKFNYEVSKSQKNDICKSIAKVLNDAAIKNQKFIKISKKEESGVQRTRQI